MRTLTVEIQKSHHFDEAANDEARHSEIDSHSRYPRKHSRRFSPIPLTRSPRQSPAGAYRQTTPSATTASPAGASASILLTRPPRQSPAGADRPK